MTTLLLPALWPSRAYAAAEDLLVRFVDAITLEGRPVARAEVILGDPAPLDCCAGYAWASVRRVFLSSTFPFDDSLGALGAIGLDPLACGTGSPAATLDVGVVRCMPTLTDGGGMPMESDVAVAVSALYADAEALVRVLSCQVDYGVTSGAANLGPTEGGCGSVVATVSVDLDVPLP